MTWSDNTSLFNINSTTGEISDTPTESEVGTYHIRITASDGTGQDTDDFTYAITDGTAPTINNLNDNDGTYAKNKNWVIYANVTDIASSIDTVFFELGGTNYTCTNNTPSNFSYTISDLGVDSYTYYFYANDTQGNLQKSDSGSLVISQAVGTATLTLDPSNSITYGTAITATCETNTDEVAPVLYRANIDVTTSENNSAKTFGAGTYDYECNFTATQNFTTSSDTDTLTISKASTATTVYLNGTASDSSIEYGDVNITMILDLAGRTIKYYRNGSLMQSATTPLENISSWTILGDYNISGIFEGEANYSSSQTDWTLTIEDTHSPTSVTISSPTDNDYLNTPPTISGTWSDDYKDTCYTNTTEYGGTSNTFSFTNTSSLSDQRYDILVTCNDTSGNTATDMVYFYFDETNPIITISSPKNITYDTNTIWMNVTLDETGSWCGYSFDGAANDTMTEGANNLWYGKKIELSETSHNVIIWCNDSYGNMESTSIVYLTVDVTNPSINYISPSVADNGYTNNDHYTINTSITDTNDITSIIDWNHSLVAWYQFKNSTDYSDQSGNGNGGIAHSASHTLEGKFGGALSLSGTGYVEIDSTASFVSGDTLTWECWIKTSETTNDNVIGGWNTNTGDNRFWFDSVQSNNLKVYDNTWHDVGVSVNDNAWHYIVVTYDTTDVVVYVDKIKRLTYQNSINFASNDLISIGQEWDADTTSGEFIGLIEDVRIWNRTLTYEEINATYDTKISRMYATFTGLEDTAYNYKVYAQDVAGNVGQTTLYTINIDTVTPTFSGYARSPDTPHEDQNVQVNVTVSETPSTFILEWNGTTNYTITSHESLEYYFTMIHGASNYTAHDTIMYYWYAIDAAGNTGKSTQQSFVVSNQAPTTPSTLTLTDPIKVTETMTASGSGSTDADAEDSLTYYYEFYNTNSSSIIQGYSTDDTYVIQVSDAHDKIRVRTKSHDGTVYSSEKEANRTVSNTAPVIEIQNTFTNSSSGHAFDVVAGIIDVDGYGDIVSTNISSSSGSCSNTANQTSGTYFNSTWHCTGTAEVSTNIIIGFTDNGEYISTTQSSNIYPNHLPAISSVDATPNSPVTTDDLVCTVSGWSDDDSDSADYYYEWYNSTTLMLTIHSTSTTHTLLAGNTSTGESWNCTVIPYDGYDNGTAFSDVVTIGNIAPEMSTPSLSPATIYTNIDIQATATYSDAEADTGTVYFKWYVDNIETYTGTFTNVANNTAKTSIFNSGNYTKGQDINCSVYSNDGSSNSDTEWSATKTVQNTAQTIEHQNAHVNASAGHSFNVTGGVSDIDGYSDIVLTNISSGNCVNIVNSTSSIYFNSTWNCTGTAFQSENIIIGFMDASNSYVQTTQSSNNYPDQPPSEPTDISGFPANLYITDTLTLSASGGVDDDGDSITYYFKYYNENDTTTRLDWNNSGYTLQQVDAHDNITIYAKSVTVYANSSGSYYENDFVDDTIPTIPSSVILNDSTIYTNDDFQWDATGSTDADGDTITYYYKINKTGYIFHNYSTINSMSCSDGSCDKNNVIYVWVFASTTIANSTSLSNSTTILNSLPTLPTGWTNLGDRLTDHTPHITFTEGSDDDGDTVTTVAYTGTTSTPTQQDYGTTNEFMDLGQDVTLNDGVTYYYRFRSWDGYEYSSSYTTSDEFHINDEPTTGTPSIVPGIIYSTTPEIMCENTTMTDPENDAITPHYEWYKNGAPLSLNHKNITNTNYTAGDIMICEIWVSDPYETNNTKLNASSVTVEGYTPVINWNYTYLNNNSIDMTPSYGETIKLNANVTDEDSDLCGVYFTLQAPNGTYIFNSINGTIYNSELWNSSTHTIDAYGYWLVNITANDSLSLSSSEQWNFTVSLGDLSYLPTSKSYSQKASETESFNVTFNHNGNSNNTINMTAHGDISDTSKFTITYYDAVTNVNITDDNFTVEEGVDDILKVNITSDVAVISGVYTGNITFERIEDNSKHNLSISVTVSALSGNAILTPEAWGISMNSVSSSSTTFTIENDGDYNLTHCNGSISTWSAYDSYNLTNFAVAQSSSVDVLVTLSSIPAGTYTKEVVFSCISTPNNGLDTDAATISATISQYTAPEIPGEQGGGGGEPTAEVECWIDLDCFNLYGDTKPYCVDGMCQSEPEIIECWIDEVCEVLFPGTKEYCINNLCAPEADVDCWSDDDCRDKYGFGLPYCVNHICSENIEPIAFDVLPKKINVTSIISDTERRKVTIHNYGKDPIRITLEFEGDKSNWITVSSRETMWDVEPMNKTDIYLNILIQHGAENELVTLKAKAVKIDDEYDTTTKEVPIYITSIDGKELGDECDSDEECLSKQCTDNKCVPYGYKPPVKPPSYGGLLIPIGIIGVLILVGWIWVVRSGKRPNKIFEELKDKISNKNS